MDSLSTATGFTMRDDVVDTREPEVSPVLVPTPRAALFSSVSFFEGLDAYGAVYELACH